MDYFYSLKDTSGYIHSIDNLIFTYYIQDIGLKSINRIIDRLHEIRNSFPDVKYWENLNISPCSKYSFFSKFYPFGRWHLSFDRPLYGLGKGKRGNVYLPYVAAGNKPE